MAPLKRRLAQLQTGIHVWASIPQTARGRVALAVNARAISGRWQAGERTFPEADARARPTWRYEETEDREAKVSPEWAREGCTRWPEREAGVLAWFMHWVGECWRVGRQ